MAPFNPIPLPISADVRPTLFVVVDTEEEFDWSAPLSRSATRVTAIRHVAKLQRLTEGYALKPTYVIDYPIVTSPEAVAIFGELLAGDRCSIGSLRRSAVHPAGVAGAHARGPRVFARADGRAEPSDQPEHGHSLRGPHADPPVQEPLHKR